MFFGTTTNAWSTLTANVVSLLPPLPVVAHTRNCPLPRPKWPIRATTHVPHPTRYQHPFKSLCQVRTRQHFLLNSIIFSIFFDAFATFFKWCFLKVTILVIILRFEMFHYLPNYPARLDNFFTTEGDNWRVSKTKASVAVLSEARCC